MTRDDQHWWPVWIPLCGYRCGYLCGCRCGSFQDLSRPILANLFFQTYAYPPIFSDLSFQISLSRPIFPNLFFQPIFLKLSFQTSLSRPIFASVSFQTCHSNLPVEAYLFKITFLYLSLEFRNLSFQSYLSRSDVLQGASRAPGRWAGGSGRPEALHCQGAVWSPPAQSSQGRRRRTLPWAAPKIFPPGRT